jgi:hypothetical protein
VTAKRQRTLSEDKLVYSGILNTAQTEHFTLVVTGYAKFFSDQTSACDSVTFNKYILGPKLTKDLGRMLNIRTDQLNAEIKAVVEKVDSQFPSKYVRFYDIDPQFEGHRFCDVDEQVNERPDPDQTGKKRLGSSPSPAVTWCPTAP